VCHLNEDNCFHRVGFGEMTTVVTTDSAVFHIEVDLFNSDNLLYSEGSALKKFYEVSSVTLVGSATLKSYMEGNLTWARFNLITGFSQINTTAVVASDHLNHCLRLIHRESWHTDQFVGTCETEGQ
jgi:hypothetical protein